MSLHEQVALLRTFQRTRLSGMPSVPAAARLIIIDALTRHDMSFRDLVAKARWRRFVSARADVIVRLWCELEWSMNRIGDLLRRDRTCIRHALKRAGVYDKRPVRLDHLTPDQVREIRTNTSVHYRVFCKRFGIHHSTVYDIRNGRIWRSVS